MIRTENISFKGLRLHCVLDILSNPRYSLIFLQSKSMEASMSYPFDYICFFQNLLGNPLRNKEQQREISHLYMRAKTSKQIG